VTFNRPCLDCGTLTSEGDRCSVCGPRKRSEWARARGPSPYADPQWRKLSAQKRKEQPWCELCGHRGSQGNPLTADHMHPLSQGGALIVPTYMLRTLCRMCHGKITKHK
jgi:5-methylcytosine-specific restriction endonuclease McrA